MIRRYVRGEQLQTADGRTHTVEAEWIDYDDETGATRDAHGWTWHWSPETQAAAHDDPSNVRTHGGD